MLPDTPWQTTQGLPQLQPLTFKPEPAHGRSAQLQKGLPLNSLASSPLRHHGGCQARTTTGGGRTSAELRQGFYSDTVEPARYQQSTLTQWEPLPELPPVEIPAPLNPRRKSATVAPDGQVAPITAHRVRRPPSHARSSSDPPYAPWTAPKQPSRRRSGVHSNPDVGQMGSAVQLDAPPPLEARAYSIRPLPSPPIAAVPTLGEISTPLSRPVNLPSDPASHSTACKPADPTNTARLAQALELRSGSLASLTSPEQTAWQRTTYIPGPIVIQKPGPLPDTPLSHLDLETFTFNPDAAPSPPDPYRNSPLDDGASIHTKRSEDTVLSDVAHYFESYGFEPVSYAGDEFWLDTEPRWETRRSSASYSGRSGRRAIVTSSTTSAELPFYYRSNSPAASAAAPDQQHRLSGGYWAAPAPAPAHRHDSFSGYSCSPSSSGVGARMSFQSVGTGQNPTSARKDSMSERERRAALKKLGATTPGTSNRVGFMRLLRGASGIV